MEDRERENSPLLGHIPASEASKPRAQTFSYGTDGRDKPFLPGATGAILTTLSPLNLNQTHCHEKDQHGQTSVNATNVRARKTLIIASILCLSFMVGEIVGGYLASSLAIMTDAAHLLTDFASFMISLFSLFVAARPATRRMSFGWHRAEVLGALVSVLMIWVITGILVYIAIQRIVSKNYEVDGEIMLITASVGVGVNLIMGFILHRGGVHGHSHGGGGGGHSHGGDGHGHGHNHSHNSVPTLTTVVEHSNDHHGELLTGTLTDVVIDQSRRMDDAIIEGQSHDHDHEHHIAPANINVRAAFIHVIGDFLQSLGVLVAALVIYFKPHLGIIDPICTFVFSVLVLITTIAIMRDALLVLMEGLPRGIDFGEVSSALLALDGVERVHDLRIWSLTMDKTALAVHLAVDRKHDSQKVLKKATELLRSRYHIFECTVQIEHFSNDMDECERCEEPKA